MNTRPGDQKPDQTVDQSAETFDSFCIYPFTALKLLATGAAQPCCVFASLIEKNARSMSVYEHSIDEIWNSEFMRNVRRAMVEGRAIAGCEYCYRQEQRGLESIRVSETKALEAGWLNPTGETIQQVKIKAAENNFDITAGPERLELDVGNLCNLKCRMCSGFYSSRIAGDSVHARWIGPGTGPGTGTWPGVARWQGTGTVIAPHRVMGVEYKGISELDQNGQVPIAWTDGDATIRLSIAEVDVAGFSINVSGTKPESHPLKILANGRALFDGPLPPGPWHAEFDLSFLAGSQELEIRFLSPVFTHASGSTAIGIGIEEARLLRNIVGTSEVKNSVLLTRFADGEQWFQQKDFLYGELLRHADRLKKVAFLGGEPLLVKEVSEMMRHLVDVGVAGNVLLTITTNGTVVDEEWCELAAKFKSVVVAVSLDGYGDVFEYIRFPGKWHSIAPNLERLRSLANAYVYAHITFQAYNMLNVVELFRYCDSNGLDFTYHFLEEPSRLSALTMPFAARKLAADRLHSYASNECRPDHKDSVLRLVATLDSTPESVDADRLHEFMVFTNDLDASRGQDFSKVNRELLDLLLDAGIRWTQEVRFAKFKSTMNSAGPQA